MNKVLTVAMISLMLGATALANPVTSFVKHPALVTRTVKGAKVVGKNAVKVGKATARYGVKVLF